MSNHYGQWQAQGDDIQVSGGHCVDWGQDEVPTKQQGQEWLQHAMDRCEHHQRVRRSGVAERKARKFIDRAPAEGYPSTLRSFYAKDDSYRNARIDVEIYGLAFCDVATERGGVDD